MRGEEMLVQRRYADGNQNQDSANEDQPQADRLIVEKAAVLLYAPDPVQRHFQGLKHAVGCKEEEHDRKPAETALGRGGEQIAFEIYSESVGEVVVHRVNDHIN